MVVHAGTALLLKPGVIYGGSVTHDSPSSRSIGYFLEPIIMLAPFAKKPLHLTLRGITSDDYDLSVRYSYAFQRGNLDISAGRFITNRYPTSLATFWYIRRS